MFCPFVRSIKHFLEGKKKKKKIVIRDDFIVWYGFRRWLSRCTVTKSPVYSRDNVRPTTAVLPIYRIRLENMFSSHLFITICNIYSSVL